MNGSLQSENLKKRQEPVKTVNLQKKNLQKNGFKNCANVLLILMLSKTWTIFKKTHICSYKIRIKPLATIGTNNGVNGSKETNSKKKSPEAKKN